MNLDFEALEAIGYALLEQGVPPTVIARALSMTPDVWRDCQKQVRVHQHGTDDLMEYTEKLMWDGLEEMFKVFQSGSPAEKIKAATAILGKTLSTQGRRTPAKLVETREQVMAMLDRMATGETAGQVQGADPRFVAYIDGGDDDAEG